MENSDLIEENTKTVDIKNEEKKILSWKSFQGSEDAEMLIEKNIGWKASHNNFDVYNEDY